MNGSLSRSLAYHHGLEFFVTDLAVSVRVDLLHHGIHLRLGEGLSELLHEPLEFLLVDRAASVRVKDGKGVPQLLVGVLGIGLGAGLHQDQEFLEIDLLVAVAVHGRDHLVQFLVGGVLAELAHDLSDLVELDGAWRACGTGTGERTGQHEHGYKDRGIDTDQWEHVFCFL